MEEIMWPLGKAVTASKPQTIDVSASIDTLALVVGMSGQEELEPVVGLLELVAKIAEIPKWEYEYGGEASMDTLVNNSEAWQKAEQNQHELHKGDEENIPSKLEGNSLGYEQCYLAAKVTELDKDESWYADGYNGNGYDGNSMHLIKTRKIDFVWTELYFTPINPDGVPL